MGMRRRIPVLYEVPSDRCSENREKERAARNTLTDSKTNPGHQRAEEMT